MPYSDASQWELLIFIYNIWVPWCNWTLRNSFGVCVCFNCRFRWFYIFVCTFYFFSLIFPLVNWYFWISIKTGSKERKKVLQWWYVFVCKRFVGIFTNYYVSNFICVYTAFECICFKLKNGFYAVVSKVCLKTSRVKTIKFTTIQQLSWLKLIINNIHWLVIPIWYHYQNNN